MQVKHWRFRGEFRRAKEILSSGRIGSVRQIHNRSLVSVESSVPGVSKKPFYLDPAGGGLFMGWSTHNFDLIRWLADCEPKQVFATVTSFSDHSIPELTTMLQELIDSIREDREPSVTGTGGRVAVEPCLAARESARTGHTIELPLSH